MLAFVKLPPQKHTPLIDQAIQAGIDFLFSVNPAGAEWPIRTGSNPVATGGNSVFRFLCERPSASCGISIGIWFWKRSSFYKMRLQLSANKARPKWPLGS